MSNTSRFNDASYSFLQKKTILRSRSKRSGVSLLQSISPFTWLSTGDSVLRSIAIKLIYFYQRYLSPKKGYSCAHRTLYGGDSCSEYVKKTLSDTSLFEASILAKKRFRACNIAYTYSSKRITKPQVPVIGPGGCEELIGPLIALILGALCCGESNRR